MDRPLRNPFAHRMRREVTDLDQVVLEAPLPVVLQ